MLSARILIPLRRISSLALKSRHRPGVRKRSGKPCIRGMRITVHNVLSYLAAEDTAEELLQHFPMLTQDDMLACLAYAADAEGRFR